MRTLQLTSVIRTQTNTTRIFQQLGLDPLAPAASLAIPLLPALGGQFYFILYTFLGREGLDRYQGNPQLISHVSTLGSQPPWP